MPVSSGYEVSPTEKMLQVSGNCENNKNVSACIDGMEEQIESDLSF